MGVLKLNFGTTYNGQFVGGNKSYNIKLIYLFSLLVKMWQD